MGAEEKSRLEKQLKSFTGTTQYYKAAFNDLLFTDGIKYLAHQTGCFWLIDTISSYQSETDEPFQLWQLNVFKDGSAILTMQTDIDQPRIVEQHIPMTDFPLNHIMLYVEHGVFTAP